MEGKHSATNLLAGIILAAGMVAAAWLLGQAALDYKGLDRHVTVKGLAEREVPADLAMWPISFTAGADTLAELDRSLNASRETIMAFLKQQGLAEAEILTGAPRIEENHNVNRNYDVPRFTAQAVLTVRTGDIASVKLGMARAGQLISRGVVLSQSYEYYPTFVYTGLNAIKPEMIAEATGNARQAAQQFANDSGSHVGAIRKATQGYFSMQDRDQYTPEVKKIRVVTTVEYYLKD